MPETSAAARAKAVFEMRCIGDKMAEKSAMFGAPSAHTHPVFNRGSEGTSHSMTT
ncbi:hypothetical protein ACFW5W_29545 [Streptomyces sp. NPDC058783]|uniref:hypothetical protein n=1 Tax=Streptomyces sp. NPDC058783 TaxID=3346633 RepID=UPI003686640B